MSLPQTSGVGDIGDIGAIGSRTVTLPHYWLRVPAERRHEEYTVMVIRIEATGKIML